jgi:hypothetical protein
MVVAKGKGTGMGSREAGGGGGAVEDLDEGGAVLGVVGFPLQPSGVGG